MSGWQTAVSKSSFRRLARACCLDSDRAFSHICRASPAFKGLVCLKQSKQSGCIALPKHIQPKSTRVSGSIWGSVLNRSVEAHKEAKLDGMFGKDLIAVRETISVFSVSGKFGSSVNFEFSAYNRCKP